VATETRREAGTAQAVGEAVGEALGALLAEADLRQSDLAERLGVSTATVSVWKRGRCPSIDQCQAIDRALRLRPGTLLRRARVVADAPLQEALEADLALDPVAVADVLAAYDRAVAEAARRRSRRPGSQAMNEARAARVLSAHDALAVGPLADATELDILRAAMSVLLDANDPRRDALAGLLVGTATE
jgi:transcriptional regulator with XRE-family HTH domain